LVTRDFLTYLDDILGSIHKIQVYIQDMDFDQFEEDFKTIDAVVRNFEIIGEASRQIPAGIKKKFPLIPWKQMSGMRDKMIHEYAGIDLETVWKTIQDDLPDLEKKLKEIRRTLK